ncbi:DNA repair protein RAD51 homolog 2 isoform X1 [Tanacetum coccineum]
MVRRHRLRVTDEEPEHFGEDVLPRPPGLQRISKSQRSSNSTASSGSNPLMYQEMVKEQYELDRKAKIEVIEREANERMMLYHSQRIAKDMKVLQIDIRGMDPADAAIINAQKARVRALFLDSQRSLPKEDKLVFLEVPFGFLGEMGEKMKISEMGLLPKPTRNKFLARNIITAKLLDAGLADVTLAVALISEIVSPPYQTVIGSLLCWYTWCKTSIDRCSQKAAQEPLLDHVQSLLEQRLKNGCLTSHLPTQLKGLDAALFGGIPFGALTELVGPSGIGKTQFCLKLSLLAALPSGDGGLDGHVIYIDVESKFSSKRLIEIFMNSFPATFCLGGKAKEMAGRITVLRPGTLAEFTESLQKFKASPLKDKVKLLIVDSMAALVSGEYEKGAPKKHPLGWHISFIKSLAEDLRIPIVMTNQVRARSANQITQYSFQESRTGSVEDCRQSDSHLVAALGIHWAHAVTIRLVLESRSEVHETLWPSSSCGPIQWHRLHFPKDGPGLCECISNKRHALVAGQRFIKVAKSPMSPPLSFPFEVTSMGIVLLNDDGVEMAGPQINAIDHQEPEFQNVVDKVNIVK